MTQTPNAASAKEKAIHSLLDDLVARFESKTFIPPDPISLPHRFCKQADVEIAGFLAAIFSWGQRSTILAKTSTFLELLDNEPHDFILHHSPSDRQRFSNFVHRTFQPLDACYLIERLQAHYLEHSSLEMLFTEGLSPRSLDVREALCHFHERFFDHPAAPERTRKHVATPARNSSCKRLNMFLRWMVRSPRGGVDFGLWRGISPRQLIIPLDVHVQRSAAQLGLLSRKQADWQAAVELTERLRQFDPEDPVKYDFALFGLGVQKLAIA